MVPSSQHQGMISNPQPAHQPAHQPAQHHPHQQAQPHPSQPQSILPQTQGGSGSQNNAQQQQQQPPPPQPQLPLTIFPPAAIPGYESMLPHVGTKVSSYPIMMVNNFDQNYDQNYNQNSNNSHFLSNFDPNNHFLSPNSNPSLFPSLASSQNPSIIPTDPSNRRVAPTNTPLYPKQYSITPTYDVSYTDNFNKRTLSVEKSTHMRRLRRSRGLMAFDKQLPSILDEFQRGLFYNDLDNTKGYFDGKSPVHRALIDESNKDRLKALIERELELFGPNGSRYVGEEKSNENGNENGMGNNGMGDNNDENNMLKSEQEKNHELLPVHLYMQRNDNNWTHTSIQTKVTKWEDHNIALSTNLPQLNFSAPVSTNPALDAYYQNDLFDAVNDRSINNSVNNMVNKTAKEKFLESDLARALYDSYTTTAHWEFINKNNYLLEKSVHNSGTDRCGSNLSGIFGPNSITMEEKIFDGNVVNQMNMIKNQNVVTTATGQVFISHGSTNPLRETIILIAKIVFDELYHQKNGDKNKDNNNQNDDSTLEEVDIVVKSVTNSIRPMKYNPNSSLDGGENRKNGDNYQNDQNGLKNGLKNDKSARSNLFYLRSLFLPPSHLLADDDSDSDEDIGDGSGDLDDIDIEEKSDEKNNQNDKNNQNNNQNDKKNKKQKIKPGIDFEKFPLPTMDEICSIITNLLISQNNDLNKFLNFGSKNNVHKNSKSLQQNSQHFDPENDFEAEEGNYLFDIKQPNLTQILPKTSVSTMKQYYRPIALPADVDIDDINDDIRGYGYINGKKMRKNAHDSYVKIVTIPDTNLNQIISRERDRNYQNYDNFNSPKNHQENYNFYQQQNMTLPTSNPTHNTQIAQYMARSHYTTPSLTSTTHLKPISELTINKNNPNALSYTYQQPLSNYSPSYTTDQHPWSKFNSYPDILMYSSDEYGQLLIDSQWTQQQTDRLMTLAFLYNCNFVIVRDRFIAQERLDNIKTSVTFAIDEVTKKKTRGHKVSKVVGAMNRFGVEEQTEKGKKTLVGVLKKNIFGKIGKKRHGLNTVGSNSGPGGKGGKNVRSARGKNTMGDIDSVGNTPKSINNIDEPNSSFEEMKDDSSNNNSSISQSDSSSSLSSSSSSSSSRPKIKFSLKKKTNPQTPQPTQQSSNTTLHTQRQTTLIKDNIVDFSITDDILQCLRQIKGDMEFVPGNKSIHVHALPDKLLVSEETTLLNFDPSPTPTRSNFQNSIQNSISLNSSQHQKSPQSSTLPSSRQRIQSLDTKKPLPIGITKKASFQPILTKHILSITTEPIIPAPLHPTYLVPFHESTINAEFFSANNANDVMKNKIPKKLQNVLSAQAQIDYTTPINNENTITPSLTGPLLNNRGGQLPNGAPYELILQNPSMALLAISSHISQHQQNLQQLPFPQAGRSSEAIYAQFSTRRISPPNVSLAHYSFDRETLKNMESNNLELLGGNFNSNSNNKKRLISPKQQKIRTKFLSYFQNDPTRFSTQFPTHLTLEEHQHAPIIPYFSPLGLGITSYLRTDRKIISAAHKTLEQLQSRFFTIQAILLRHRLGNEICAVQEATFYPQPTTKFKELTVYNSDYDAHRRFELTKIFARNSYLMALVARLVTDLHVLTRIWDTAKEQLLQYYAREEANLRNQTAMPHQIPHHQHQHQHQHHQQQQQHRQIPPGQPGHRSSGQGVNAISANGRLAMPNPAPLNAAVPPHIPQTLKPGVSMPAANIPPAAATVATIVTTQTNQPVPLIAGIFQSPFPQPSTLTPFLSFLLPPHIISQQLRNKHSLLIKRQLNQTQSTIVNRIIAHIEENEKNAHIAETQKQLQNPSRHPYPLGYDVGDINSHYYLLNPRDPAIESIVSKTLVSIPGAGDRPLWGVARRSLLHYDTFNSHYPSLTEIVENTPGYIGNPLIRPPPIAQVLGPNNQLIPAATAPIPKNKQAAAAAAAAAAAGTNQPPLSLSLQIEAIPTTATDLTSGLLSTASVARQCDQRIVTHDTQIYMSKASQLMPLETLFSVTDILYKQFPDRKPMGGGNPAQQQRTMSVLLTLQPAHHYFTPYLSQSLNDQWEALHTEIKRYNAYLELYKNSLQRLLPLIAKFKTLLSPLPQTIAPPLFLSQLNNIIQAQSASGTHLQNNDNMELLEAHLRTYLVGLIEKKRRAKLQLSQQQQQQQHEQLQHHPQQLPK
jgi:hypothetical protein